MRWTTESVAKEMLKENCILLSEYINCNTKLEYEYNGKKILCTMEKLDG